MKPKILIVDDNPHNLYTLEQLLQMLDVEVIQTTSPYEALNLALLHPFFLAIVDVKMPELNGYELVQHLREVEETKTLPIIFVSAIYADEFSHHKGYEAGAVDFMSKPFNPDVLLSKVKVFLALYRQQEQLAGLVKQLEHEITQRQQTEAALQQANEQLAGLNADKDKFISILAHDLRSPFQPLLKQAEQLALYGDRLEGDRVKSLGQSLHTISANLFDLLENLLQWSRLQQGRVTYQAIPLNLTDLLSQNAQLLQDIAYHKQIKLRAPLTVDLLVLADEHMLNTIVRNLTSNALKFTPLGGQVTLLAQPHQQSAELVEIWITDTGVGMSETIRAKLFDITEHHTTLGTTQEKGTGLGLLICQEMVLKHGGRIWVESELNQGTTVKFTLPVAEGLPTGDWLGNPSSEATNSPVMVKSTTYIVPPHQDLTELYRLVKRGSMKGVRLWARQQIAQDEQYRSFAEEVTTLAKGFDGQELETLVKAYLS